MAGLALGNHLFGRLADRSRNTLLLYALLEGGIGLHCLAIPALITLGERLYLTLYQGFHLSYSTFSLIQFVLVFLILMIPTSLMGATLPVLSRYFVGDEATLGRRVGFLYTLGKHWGQVLPSSTAGSLAVAAHAAVAPTTAQTAPNGEPRAEVDGEMITATEVDAALAA